MTSMILLPSHSNFSRRGRADVGRCITSSFVDSEGTKIKGLPLKEEV